MEKIKLLPCPFCDGESVHNGINFSTIFHKSGCFISHLNCIPDHSAKIIESWNRRPAPEGKAEAGESGKVVADEQEVTKMIEDYLKTRCDIVGDVHYLPKNFTLGGFLYVCNGHSHRNRLAKEIWAKLGQSRQAGVDKG